MPNRTLRNMSELQRSAFLLEGRQDVEGSGRLKRCKIVLELRRALPALARRARFARLCSSLRLQWWVVYLVASGSVLPSNEAQQNPFAIADACRALGGCCHGGTVLGPCLPVCKTRGRRPTANPEVQSFACNQRFLSRHQEGSKQLPEAQRICL